MPYFSYLFRGFIPKWQCTHTHLIRILFYKSCRLSNDVVEKIRKARINITNVSKNNLTRSLALSAFTKCKWYWQPSGQTWKWDNRALSSALTISHTNLAGRQCRKVIGNMRVLTTVLLDRQMFPTTFPPLDRRQSMHPSIYTFCSVCLVCFH